MPRLDGTGPNGMGQKTGRGMGNCVGGAGIGGGGRGYGCRNGNGFNSRRFISDKNELASLEYKEKALEEELAIIREEKEALKSQKK